MLTGLNTLTRHGKLINDNPVMRFHAIGEKAGTFTQQLSYAPFSDNLKLLLASSTHETIC